MTSLSNSLNYYLYAISHVLQEIYHRLFKIKSSFRSSKHIPYAITPRLLDLEH